MIVWAAADGMARLATFQSNHRWTQIKYPSVSIRGSQLFGSALATLILATCALLTSRQLSYWQNTTTLFEHALQVTQNNDCAHFSLGNELADQGKIPEAMEHWEAALKIDPRRADIHGSIAGALASRVISRGHRALPPGPAG